MKNNNNNNNNDDDHDILVKNIQRYIYYYD